MNKSTGEVLTVNEPWCVGLDDTNVNSSMDVGNVSFLVERLDFVGEGAVEPVMVPFPDGIALVERVLVLSIAFE